MATTTTLNRRYFLKTGTSTGVALVVGFHLSDRHSPPPRKIKKKSPQIP
jgi:hypothetical protein